MKVPLETIVISNMKQLIDELSGAIAYLGDMGITNEDTGLKHQATGIYRSIVNAKNIAYCLKLDAEMPREKYFEKYGAAFKVEDGVLYQSPETTPNRDEDWIEVTAPQVAGDKAAHEFLNDINKVFGTDYKLEQFAGR